MTGSYLPLGLARKADEPSRRQGRQEKESANEVLHGQRRWWIINGNMPATKSVGERYKGYFTESVGLTEVV